MWYFLTCWAAFWRFSRGSLLLFKNKRSLFSRGGGSFLRWGLGDWYSILWNTLWNKIEREKYPPLNFSERHSRKEKSTKLISIEKAAIYFSKEIVCLLFTRTISLHREINTRNIFVSPHLLLAAKTALTAQTGSLVSPTKNVTSHSSGIDAKNFMSSARPDLFSKVLRSGSSLSASAMVKLWSGIETLPGNKINSIYRHDAVWKSIKESSFK